ncbi:MAG: hypothetical protein GX579_21810 [Chloroflexi bacterium]|jgi:hypothetical protein|nr:hypothetical protein [Chloroflexota bacterium]
MSDYPIRYLLDQAAIYEIQVQGLLSEQWRSYFDSFAIEVEGEDGWARTTLTGLLVDQAALQGVLQQLYSLGMVLLRIERKED